jgi:hypothetical protein
MLVYWLKIALKHLECAREQHGLAVKNVDESGEIFYKYLESEFFSSIQAIISVATAFDSFYAEVKSVINIPKIINDTWRKNKTKRWAQVCEVLRIAYKLNNENFQKIRKYCRQLYRFRDFAVHPSTESKQLQLYSELNLLLEWRLATYRYENAFKRPMHGK